MFLAPTGRGLRDAPLDSASNGINLSASRQRLSSSVNLTLSTVEVTSTRLSIMIRAAASQ